MCNRYNFRCKNDNRPNCRFRETDLLVAPEFWEGNCFKAFSAIDVFVPKLGFELHYYLKFISTFWSTF